MLREAGKSIWALHRAYYGKLRGKNNGGKGRDLGHLDRNKYRKIEG